MYRNSPDKRVKQSASQLYDAIKQLLLTKPFDQIGIKEVCETAGIGRATFYRNFDYVEDVLKLKLDEAFNQLQASLLLDQPDEQITLKHFFEYWVTKADILETLINAEHWDIFAFRFHEVSTFRLTEIAQSAGFSGVQIDYLQNNANALLTSTLHTWLQKGQKENAEELFSMFQLPFMLYIKRQGEIGAFSTSEE